MNSETLFKILKCVGSAIGALASLILACFGIRKEVKASKKAKEAEEKEKET